MAWTIKYSEYAAKQMKKMDKSISKKIDSYLNNKIAIQDDPCNFAKKLGGDLDGIWRLRMEDYRILCEIKDSELIILVLRLGHRKHIYD